jgi:wobble nucleotide-excising tRNase
MGDFYGKKGIYPDKKGRDLKVGDINKALAVYLKKYAGDKFTGDSLDRERVRDILIKMRKLDPDYSKKESVKEKVNEAVEPRGNIKKVLDVAKNKQAKKIGGTLVDLTTAGMMTQVWDKVNDSSKEKMNRMNTKQLINLILKLWKKVV